MQHIALLGAIGIPILRGSYGGNDAQQSRAIQISDLTVKVAEIERIKTEIGAKTREKIQQLMLDFLANHARKLGQCSFSLEDVTHVHVEKYRDTSGVGVEAYREILNEVDRASVKGKRDYAIDSHKRIKRFKTLDL